MLNSKADELNQETNAFVPQQNQKPQPYVTIDDPFKAIYGYEKEKAILRQIADTLIRPQDYAKLGSKPPRGLLINGQPGLGKSLMCETLIEATGLPYFVCRKDQSNGDFVATIKETFQLAADCTNSKHTYTIVYLDDMDKFSNVDQNHRDSEEYVTIQTCIDQTKHSNVFVLATINSERNLPASLMREGRFDIKLDVKPPMHADRMKIINKYLQGKAVAAGINIERISKIMIGRSCAALETALNNAGIDACYAGLPEITMDILQRSCFDVNDEIKKDKALVDPTWTKDKLNDCHNLRSIIAYHEAGHAVVSEILHPGSIFVVTNLTAGEKDTHILEYDSCALGFVSRQEEAARAQLDDIDSKVMQSLGGMAASDCVFGIHDAGCSNDLRNARRVILDNVESTALCGVSRLRPQMHDLNQKRDYDIQTCVDTLLEQYLQRTKTIIAQNREFLDALALALCERGILFEDEIQEIKAKCTIKEFRPFV